LTSSDAHAIAGVICIPGVPGFTSTMFVNAMESAAADVTLDGRGRWLDSQCTERLWHQGLCAAESGHLPLPGLWRDDTHGLAGGMFHPDQGAGVEMVFLTRVGRVDDKAAASNSTMAQVAPQRATIAGCLLAWPSGDDNDHYRPNNYPAAVSAVGGAVLSSRGYLIRVCLGEKTCLNKIPRQDPDVILRRAFPKPCPFKSLQQEEGE
jgi:hypothetical protein